MRGFPELRPCLRAALAALSLAIAAVPAHGQEPGPVAGPRNVYAAGGEVRPAQPVRGDLVAAGGRVLLEQPVGADAALAGGSVDVRAPVAEDLRVAGGSITLASGVGGDLFAAGADIALQPGSTVAGAAELNGASIRMQGRIRGALRGRAQKIVVDGEVGGPTHLSAERIELGPRARLMGPLTYLSPAEVSRAEGAIVQGPVTREAAPGPARAGQASGGGGTGVPGALLVYIALFAFSSAFVLLMPGFSDGAAARLRASPGTALGIGVAGLLAMPVAMVLLFLTILGIPLGLALIGVAPVLLLVGFVVGVLCMTRLLPGWLGRPAPSGQSGRQLGRYALALLLVLLSGLVPVAGALFIALLALAGVGAGVLQLRARRAGATSAASPPGLPPLPGHDVFPA